MARKIKREKVTEVPTGVDELTLPRWFPRMAQNPVTGALVATEEVCIFCPRLGDPTKAGEGKTSCGQMARIRRENVDPDGTYRNFGCTHTGCDFLGDLKLLGWPASAPAATATKAG